MKAVDSFMHSVQSSLLDAPLTMYAGKCINTVPVCGLSTKNNTVLEIHDFYAVIELCNSAVADSIQ